MECPYKRLSVFISFATFTVIQWRVTRDMPSIDIVDFAPFLDGSAKQRAADQILDSFKSTGFVYLANFGLSNEEVQEMFDWVRR